MAKRRNGRESEVGRIGPSRKREEGERRGLLNTA
jgi:hypothetical protein